MLPVLGLRFWNLSIKFDHDWRVTRISLLERFCKSFIFLETPLLEQKILNKDFWEVSFLFLVFQSLETMIQFLYNFCVGNETRLKKLTEVSNYGKFICNRFRLGYLKIGTIRAKVHFSVGIKNDGLFKSFLFMHEDSKFLVTEMEARIKQLSQKSPLLCSCSFLCLIDTTGLRLFNRTKPCLELSVKFNQHSIGSF